MSESALRRIIASQKEEIERRLRQPYIERDVTIPMRDYPIIKVIIGPRRCGKSTLATHLLQSLGHYGYVNFDDDRRLLQVEDSQEIVDAINDVYGSPRYLLLDEIQNFPNWELFANRLHRSGYHLVITGSNSNLLAGELATHLTGRHLPIVLFPFSFAEMLKNSSDTLSEPEKATALKHYLERGGYPESVLQGTASDGLYFQQTYLFAPADGGFYLQSLWNSVIYKDVVQRHRIRSSNAMNSIAAQLINNVAAEYSLKKLAKSAPCSEPTALKYIGYLEEAFLLFSLQRFSYKTRERMTSNQKIYCIDNGFITACGDRFMPEAGKLAENAVAIALHRRAREDACKVYFWRGERQWEVDFVVSQNEAVTHLIQVCWDMSDSTTADREVRSLINASQELNCDRLIILTGNPDAQTQEFTWRGTTREIQTIPLWRWLEQQDPLEADQQL